MPIKSLKATTKSGKDTKLAFADLSQCVIFDAVPIDYQIEVLRKKASTYINLNFDLHKNSKHEK